MENLLRLEVSIVRGRKNGWKKRGFMMADYIMYTYKKIRERSVSYIQGSHVPTNWQNKWPQGSRYLPWVCKQLLFFYRTLIFLFVDLLWSGIVLYLLFYFGTIPTFELFLGRLISNNSCLVCLLFPILSIPPIGLVFVCLPSDHKEPVLVKKIFSCY